VGTLILAGKPDPSVTNSGNFALAVGGNGQPVIQAFDQFGSNNYPGIQSVTGAGSALIAADVTSFDPAFFLTPVTQLSFNTNTTTPFETTDPSALFVGSPGGSPPNVTPHIGTINGVNGADFQFQADANNSFIVAAPAIAIAKQTNGQTALNPPGPTVPVGSTVTWTYDVTNPGNEPLKNVVVTDDNGTPNNPADDFHPTPVLVNGFNIGDTNHDGLLDPGETWVYTATQVATMGQYTNTATVTALSPAGLPVAAQTLSNHLGVCPMVINVQRFGIHHQPTQIVVTFNGPLTPAQAENINNYHLFTLGPDGKFSREDPIVSAVYNPATNSVTLTAARRINVHHLSEIAVTNPCPGGPPFVGVLNRKFSLGAIVGHHGHVTVPRKTNVPGVLNPAVLPKVLTPANEPLVLRLARKPESSAFVSVNMPQAISSSQSKSWPLHSLPISAARRLINHLTTIRDLGRHIRKSISQARG
jgi:hypothetical protein